MQGPLGKVWVAATLGESRISKSFAVNAQITIICKNIEQPPAPFALRLSSALLLGVVRVFNRKSSIILADANSVMQTLMRYKLGHNTTTTTTKRKSHGKSNATNANRISLNDADNIARFDRITIPVSKKRKTAIVANKKLIANAITIGQTTNNLGDQPSPATITIDSFSYGGSGEIDVLAAMETVFPTLLIPNDANPLPIALSTGSQQNRSSVTRRLSFMARDQDITLSNPSIHVGGAPIELSDQELQLSFHSNPASNHDLSQDAWMPGFTSDDQLALQANIHQSPDGNQMSPANPHDDVSLEPLQIAPLEIMPVDQPRAQFTGTAPQARNSIMNSSKRPSPARSVMMAPPSLSNEDLNRDGNSYQNTTPEQNIRRKRVSPVETSSTQKKKRRSPLLRIDTVVELSPSQVRDSLRDTTDIVLAEFDERSPKRRKRSQKNTRNKDDDVEDDLPMPGFVGGFAKDITDFWRDITTKKKTISKGNQSNETRARSKQGGKKAVVREDASSAQAMQRTEVAVPDNEEVSPPQVILGNEEVGVGSGRGDSSVDIDRGGEGSKSRSNDQFSLPSNSQGRDSSGRGNVNNAPSSNGSRNLADLIDTVSVGMFIYSCGAPFLVIDLFCMV